MWWRYTTRHYAYGVDTGEGVTVTGDFARTPPAGFYLNPRLGASHPITDRAAMHFSLGRCLQWPDLYRMYAKSYRNLFRRIGPDGDPSWEDVNGNGMKDTAEYLSNMVPHWSGFGGDPWVRPEETLTFEVGAQWSFVSDYTGTLTLFYRSETQQLSSGHSNWWDPVRDRYWHLRGLGNSSAGYAKGIELAVEKRLSHCFSFRVAWTSLWSARGQIGLTQYGTFMFPDSNFVASKEFWYAFAPNPDGSQTPMPLSDAEKRQIGGAANRAIRDWSDLWRNRSWIQMGVMAEPQDKGIFVSYWAPVNTLGTGPINSWGEKSGGVLSQANVQVVLNTPPDVRTGARWMGWLASNLSVNLLWKMRSGRAFTWTTPQETESKARGPVDTVTDLSVEKVFNARGRVRPSFFLEVRNLFNDGLDADPDKDYEPAVPKQDYMRWGLQMRRPDDSLFVKYGDDTGHRFFHPPRQWSVGVRMVF
jgi:hypothetical protein